MELILTHFLNFDLNLAVLISTDEKSQKSLPGSALPLGILVLYFSQLMIPMIRLMGHAVIMIYVFFCKMKMKIALNQSVG